MANLYGAGFRTVGMLRKIPHVEALVLCPFFFLYELYRIYERVRIKSLLEFKISYIFTHGACFFYVHMYTG